VFYSINLRTNAELKGLKSWLVI